MFRQPVRKLLASFIKIRPGLGLLILILTLISIVSIKPDFYLIGWDNYSSYFEPEINIPRTLFSTWREYRGFGVPSDSEVVDIFRQVFSYAVGLIFGIKLAEQIYYLLMLWLGVLGMYSLVQTIHRRMFPSAVNIHGEIAASTAGFFYLFNLQTLAVFYFPIVTYITRYGFLPILLLWFYRYFTEKSISATFILSGALLFVLSSGSYVTGTVFLTTLVVLVLAGVFLGKWKRVLSVQLFFILINLFWLAPFVNYTVEKSGIIRLAPTYIDANEGQLNKPAETYSWTKQLIFFPSFFDTVYQNFKTKNNEYLHPLASDFSAFPDAFGIYLFPVIYLSGTLYMVIRWRVYRKHLFLPVITIVFIVFSMKEYSAFGSIYRFLDHHLPYFGIIFRFGDTKFHPYIAFSASIISGLLFALLYSKLDKLHKFKKAALLFVGIIFVMTLYSFRLMWSGKLIGWFMYNDIPEGYRQAAQVINETKGTFRVLHLPYDRSAYWRSYTWGGIGSAFLQYYLKKPLMEKTFEPGSMENAYFNQRVLDIVNGSQFIDSDLKLHQKADELHRLLSDANIRYILMDESVSSVVAVKSASFWGSYAYYDAARVVKAMVQSGTATLVQSFPLGIDSGKYLALLEESPELSEIEQSEIRDKKLNLYEIRSPKQTVTFSDKISYIDSADAAYLLHPDYSNTTVIQDREKPGIVSLLRRSDLNISDTGSALRLDYPDTKLSDKEYFLKSGLDADSAPGAMVSVIVSADSQGLVFTFRQIDLSVLLGEGTGDILLRIDVPSSAYRNLMPTSDDSSDFAADWHVLNQSDIGPLRLLVGETSIPVPNLSSGQSKDLGTVMVNQQSINVSLHGFAEENAFSVSDFRETDNPNCYADKLDGYVYEIDRSSGLTVKTTSGSTCVISALKRVDYTEIDTSVSGVSDVGISETEIDRHYLLELSGIPRVKICIQGETDSLCLNKHSNIKTNGSNRVILPIDRKPGNAEGLNLLLALSPSAGETLTATFEGVSQRIFREVVPPQPLIVHKISAQQAVTFKDNKLTVFLPKALSPYSFYFNSDRDAFLTATGACNSPGFRSMRAVDDISLMLLNDCSNELLMELPYSSKVGYLWTIDYNLFSGKFPRFEISDRYRTVFSGYTSLEQGYPDIDGFMNLKSLNWGQYPRSIASVVRESPFKMASVWIGPSDYISDSGSKAFSLKQDSENIGITGIRGTNLVAFPSDWKGLELSPDMGTAYYDKPADYRYRELLPSLWEVSVTGGTDANGSWLLRFSQGYDQQWKLISSVRDLLPGVNSGLSKRCDGFANCFEVPAFSGTRKFYLLYTPGIVSLIGWGISLITLTFVLIRVILPDMKFPVTIRLKRR